MRWFGRDNNERTNQMHYKNGREAKNGDRVILLPNGYRKVAVAGILYDATAGNNDCNGKIAVTTANDPMPDLKEVLHADDVAAVANVNGIPDSTKTTNVGD